MSVLGLVRPVSDGQAHWCLCRARGCVWGRPSEKAAAAPASPSCFRPGLASSRRLQPVRTGSIAPFRHLGPYRREHQPDNPATVRIATLAPDGAGVRKATTPGREAMASPPPPL